MAQVLVRDLTADVVRKLKARARQSGRSLEAELRTILEQAVTATLTPAEVRARLRRVQAMFAGRRFSDSAVLIRRDRQR